MVEMDTGAADPGAVNDLAEDEQDTDAEPVPLPAPRGRLAARDGHRTAGQLRRDVRRGVGRRPRPPAGGAPCRCSPTWAWWSRSPAGCSPCRCSPGTGTRWCPSGNGRPPPACSTCDPANGTTVCSMTGGQDTAADARGSAAAEGPIPADPLRRHQPVGLPGRGVRLRGRPDGAPRPERIGQDQGTGGAVPVRAGWPDRAPAAQSVRRRGTDDEVQPALPRPGFGTRLRLDGVPPGPRLGSRRAPGGGDGRAPGCVPSGRTTG